MSSTSPATKDCLAKIGGEGESPAESLIESASKFENDSNCCDARRASYPVYPSSSNSRVDINADMAFNYSLRPIFFVLFEKSNFLREHHLLSCLPFKNV